jgi:molecular chaperone DnaK
MSNTINFGIDLGTTNSVIAKFEGGRVEVFKNPIGHKETLPSVVAFRKDRIIVGDKAREYVDRDPENVFGSFKRKMGTSESFFVMSLADFKTPIELSGYVLKELKNFVYTGESLDAAVITIPASFDTIQSNATKKAGYAAGYNEVVLLQEPIAASLAYANKEDNNLPDSGQWLVYDLGGGTFDVALVRIKDGEMKIVDHQGDNFLGGLDFDGLIIDKIIVPYLYSTGKFEALEHELKSSKGKYNKLFFKLLHKAEEVKVQLSSRESTDIEFTIEDNDGEEMDIYFSITRNQFESIIAEKVEETVSMIESILTRNEVPAADLKFVLMVGGSTYIPLVRNMIKQRLGIEVNCGIDPTTAVAVGAAYYAGTKTKTVATPAKETAIADTPLSDITIKTAYQRTSQESEEYFTAIATGNIENRFYRIRRQDGGYDSGLKKLEERITELLPLVTHGFNHFTLGIYDELNNPINVLIPPIEIVHGKFSVAGQPLPNDICLEVDDYENNQTKLEVIFTKNAILPLKKTVTKKLTKTIGKGSNDKLIINVLEGSRFATPTSVLPIGTIEILGKTISRDIVKNSDIEITLEISESRDLKITTYISMTDQEFINLFTPSERSVSVVKLRDEIENLLVEAKREVPVAEGEEDYERASRLGAVGEDLQQLYNEALSLSDEYVTDTKFQIEDKKRKLSLELDHLTKNKQFLTTAKDYYSERDYTTWLVTTYGNDNEKKGLQDFLKNEKDVLASGSPIYLRDQISRLQRLRGPVSWRTPEMLIGIYKWYAIEAYDKYLDQRQADKYILEGEKALDRQNYDELKVVITRLDAMLPEDKKQFDIKGTGIS